MKLVTYRTADGSAAPGALSEDLRRVIDLRAEFPDMLALIDAGEAGLEKARRLAAIAARTVPLDGVRLLAPVPEPRQIRDFMCSAQHVRDASRGMARLKARLAGEPPADQSRPPGTAIPEIYARQPIYYISNRFNVSGPDAEIEWPRYCDYLDYELEIGMFIGRTGRNIPVERAREHIFGYTVFNDFSARDRQAREMEGRMGPAKGKSFDTGNAVGPWIVTRDELPDIHELDVAVRVNGEVWGHNTTSGLLHSFEQMIAFVSEDETLHAGELFGSGTIGGCCGLEIDRWLKDGDVVELEIAKIGVLRNRVVRARA